MNKFFSLILCFTLLCFTGCSKKEEGSELNPSNKLIVGTSADNPPYEFISEGVITGYDIDLANEIAKELNQELIIKNLDFPGLLPSILSQNVDMLMAALTITPERLENVDFSDTYTMSEMAILYREDSEYKAGENFADKIIGVQFGTTWEAYAKKLQQGSSKGQIKSLANNLALVQELLNQNVDIVIMEDLQVTKFIKKYPNLKSLPIVETKSNFAIVLPKNSTLTPRVNEIIKKLEQNGTLEKLKNKWLAQ